MYNFNHKKRSAGMGVLASLFVMFVMAIMTLNGCNKEESSDNTNTDESTKAIFAQVPSEKSHIDFNNKVTETPDLNYFSYQYIYNGGGVAVGDINNDGLPDLYFTANQLPNKLYLNKGNLEFEDITDKAGVAARDGWKTGVSMVDINNDGNLDIYVSRSGNNPDPDLRRNLLYVNNGDNTFTEKARDYGIDDPGYSTQSYFADFDKDGDLDMYLVSHRIDFQNNDLLYDRSTLQPTEFDSDKLYKNNGSAFTDISKEAGISNKAWGLSASIGDFNNDGWEDIYVANDFLEPDMLYINQGDGTFKEEIGEHISHISFYGMGSDFADINNDGFADLYVLDMVAPQHERSKRTMASMNPPKFWKMVDNGYNYQYMSNTLQLNNGNGNFSEINQIAGVGKTDWSWAPLFADFDNDGMKDLFVTNGITKDVTDNDFKISLQKKKAAGEKVTFEEVMGMMPGTKVANYIYRNTGNFKFKSMDEPWKMDQKVNSNGAAYADLDNDGDLEIVINNLDDVASIYENLATKELDNNYLQVKFKGPETNPNGYGAKVYLINDDGAIQYQELYPSRGYLSSVESILHFGVGKADEIKKLVIQWPDGKQQTKENVSTNQVLEANYSDANETATPVNKVDPKYFQEAENDLGIDFKHTDVAYDDFVKESLIPHKQSQNGPFISVGDVNGDGMEDFYIGGAAGQSGELYIQTGEGKFAKAESQPWEADKASEDMGSVFFDADGDGDMDLYVSSGSNEFPEGSPLLAHRLYINDGKGAFTKSSGAIPSITTSGMAVTAGDYDGDGDMDLFVGGRVTPAKYPYSPRSCLLKNDGGKFTDVTETDAPGLVTPGMITDAEFTDFDKDGDMDLAFVGEWMPICLFQNDGGKFKDVSKDKGLDDHSSGWWYSVAPADLDGDGDMDFICGNLGANNKFHPSGEKPLQVYSTDFDDNGTNDIVLAKFSNDKKCLPVRGRECSSGQMPFILDKFPTYQSFAEASLQNIYTEDKLNRALKLEAKDFESCVIINNNGKYEMSILPIEAQFSPIAGAIVMDVNKDGNMDIVAAGNNFGAEVETIRYDAGRGTVLLGDGKGGFKPVNLLESGFFAPGDVKDIKLIHVGADKKPVILVANNNAQMQAFSLK